MGRPKKKWLDNVIDWNEPGKSAEVTVMAKDHDK